MSTDTILIRGAREHNLENLSLELPREKLIVFTGPSGSRKSSLVFDTIYAERTASLRRRARAAQVAVAWNPETTTAPLSDRLRTFVDGTGESRWTTRSGERGCAGVVSTRLWE